jgi:DeoR family transcriptional regulator of aga operon
VDEPIAVRLERLATMVVEEGFLRVADAGDVLGVSEVTIRSDLARLERDGRVRRVHGGAMPPVPAEREASVEASSARDATLKRAIGRRAAALVSSGSSILLDVGSTTQAVAEALVDRQDLVDLIVVTNGLGIALALEPAVPRFTVIVTGGSLRPLQHSLVAPGALRALADLHVDLAIIGCNGIDDDGRVTNVNLPETEIKQAMLTASSSAILVADGSKAGQRHLGTIGALADFDAVVTGGLGADRIREAASAAGTRVFEGSAERRGR